MSHRKGATLVEVLVAIFIMAIGLIAILSLFPIGVLRMIQAIQDDRSTHSGYNADAIATAKGVRNDSTVTAGPDPFQNPGDGLPDRTGNNGPSYGVLVDPLGWSGASASTSQKYVGGIPGISRRSVSFVEGLGTAAARNMARVKWFTFLDDINFDPDTGYPKGARFTRETNYSWAFLLQRPRASDASVVNLSVVVFKRRPLSLTGNLTLAETVASSATYDTTRNVVTFNSNPLPAIAVGDWILDSSMPTMVTSPHAYFYRVVGVNEVSATSVELEVQTPLRGFPPNATSAGSAIFLEGVSAVLEKGPGRIP